jgi:hypothetical protein
MNRIALALCLTSCSVAHHELQAELAPIAATPQPIQENYFARDRTGGISEEHLRDVLAAPLFLEEKARLGVVPVSNGYEPDSAIPTIAVPESLVAALEDSGIFETATEVSTEWPMERGLPGLRELAARYHSQYLLLYRHRFVEETDHNGWAAGYATVVGALFFPGQQLQVDGVLEATLYDAKTGQILFTVNQRIHESQSAAPTTQLRRERELQEKMLATAAPKLAELVVSKCRHLEAARPTEKSARVSAISDP